MNQEGNSLHTPVSHGAIAGCKQPWSIRIYRLPPLPPTLWILCCMELCRTVLLWSCSVPLLCVVVCCVFYCMLCYVVLCCALCSLVALYGFTCLCVCVCVCVCGVCVCMCVCVSLFPCLYVCVCVRLFTCLCVSLCLSACLSV